MVLDYEVKLKLVAFTQQVLHGPMESADLPPLGAFDMIGKDRRRAWSALGKMTKEVGNYLTFSGSTQHNTKTTFVVHSVSST